MKRTLIASALLASALTANAATPVNDTTIVLVHGAFADGSSWDKVIPILQAKGYKVVAVQNPLSSLADDVVATKRVVDAQTGKVVLVGHSWGGTVITEAGTSDKIKALVYVAAFAPSEGEASGNLGKNYAVPPGVPTLTPDAAGYLWLPADSVAKNFAQDVSPATAALIAATQGPINSKAFGETTTVAAWKTKPNYYIVATKDRMIAPELEAAFAKKLNAVTTTLPTSHVPMVSQPAKVAEVILAAAQR
jgi:pimeloyl-ACP methyl ester carboxylesterase